MNLFTYNRVITFYTSFPYLYINLAFYRFLEEIYDRGVRIDRTLMQFNQLGIFNKTKAIIFGDILCGNDPQGGQTCFAAINYFASNLKIPVFSIKNFGHGNKNFPLPLNVECLITTKANNFALKFTG